jgi:hypothetical protein
LALLAMGCRSKGCAAYRRAACDHPSEDVLRVQVEVKGEAVFRSPPTDHQGLVLVLP